MDSDSQDLVGTVDAKLAALGLAETHGPDSTLGLDAATPTLTPQAPPQAERTIRPALPRLSVDLDSEGERAPTTASPSRDLEIVGLLGAGGMGRVLLARQHSLERDVAIKTAHHDATDAAHWALLREGRIAGQLEHPAIVPVHALGVDGGERPVLVMKRIEGVAWDVLLSDPEHSAWADWDGEGEDRLGANLSILTTICNAVHYAHSRGIVHRDLKPENVLIGRFGDVYLADWGVGTKIGTQAERLAGTPRFMAPEMVVGGTVDERTDVYLLGAVLHVILTGRPRHDADLLARALFLAALSDPFDYDDDVPAELGALANRACAADASERPPTALEFRDAITTFLRHRAANRIADEAFERLVRVRSLADSETLSAEETAEFEQLSAEARFGLEQALEDLDGDHEAARAHEELSGILAARRARLETLERIAHERDLRVGAAPRAVLLGTMAVLALLLASLTFWMDDTPSVPTLVGFAAGLWVTAAAGTFVARHTMLRTTLSRSLSVSVLLPFTLMLLSRLGALVVETPASELFIRELFVAGTSCAVVGVATVRWVMVPGAFALVGALVAMLVPEHAIRVYAVAMSGLVVSAAFFAWRDTRASGPNA